MVAAVAGYINSDTDTDTNLYHELSDEQLVGALIAIIESLNL